MNRSTLRRLAVGAVAVVALAWAAPVHSQQDDAAPIPVVGYDISETPGSGFGGWSHTYSGTRTLTGRTFNGGFYPGVLYAYAGGAGSLNDGIVPTTLTGTHLFFAGPAASDPGTVTPQITLRLDGNYLVDRVDVYGGDIQANIYPGIITAANITIGDTAVTLASEPFGPAVALGLANDRFDLSATPLAAVPTDTVVISDIQRVAWDQFSIAEIAVHGRTAPPPATVESLLGGLQLAVADQEPGHALYDKITHALNKWAAGKPIPACNAIIDFVSLVTTQTGKSIDPADAERWLADAAQAATLMGC